MRRIKLYFLVVVTLCVLGFLFHSFSSNLQTNKFYALHASKALDQTESKYEALEDSTENQKFDVSLKRAEVLKDAKYSIANSIYSITPKIISYKNNSFIVYPYINIFEDYEKEQKINELIEKYFLYSNNKINLLFIYEENSSLKTAEEVGTYLDYEITYATDGLFSILFHGNCLQDYIMSKYDNFNILEYMSNERFAERNDGISPACTINIETGREVILSDILPMSKELEDGLRDWKFLNNTNIRAINYYTLFEKNNANYNSNIELYNYIIDIIIASWEDFGKLELAPYNNISIFNGSCDIMLTEDDIYIIYNPDNTGGRPLTYFYLILNKQDVFNSK